MRKEIGFCMMDQLLRRTIPNDHSCLFTAIGKWKRIKTITDLKRVLVYKHREGQIISVPIPSIFYADMLSWFHSQATWRKGHLYSKVLNCAKYVPTWVRKAVESCTHQTNSNCAD